MKHGKLPDGHSPRQALTRAQAWVAQFVPADVSLADELLAERRREAAAEDEEFKAPPARRRHPRWH